MVLNMDEFPFQKNIASEDLATEQSQSISYKNIPWWQVDLGPEAAKAASAAVSNRKLSQGTITEEVEQKIASLVGSTHAIATSSGSTAISLALMAAGVQPGDKVLCPAYTWIATAHAAQLIGCNIELIDIERQRPVIDVNLVPEIIDNRTFIIPVHMNGHAVDIESLKAKGYIVIEDAAQALGSSLDGISLGSMGHLGCYSFSVSKIIGSGQGGIIVTDSDEYAERARKARTHGVVDVFAPECWENLGHNFRYNDVLASVLLTQIPLLHKRLTHSRDLVRAYRDGFSELNGIDIIEHQSEGEVGPYIEARVSSDSRNGLVEFLEKEGIGARRAFPPLSSARYLQISNNNAFPNAMFWSQEVLYLPSGPALSIIDVDRVVDAVRRCLHD